MINFTYCVIFSINFSSILYIFECNRTTYMKSLLFITALITAFYSFSQQPPNAQFTASPLTICVGDPIVFTDQSIPGAAPITSYSWNFGNGETSNQQNVTYTYPSPGTYTVTLAIQAGNGQADAEVKPAYITVNPKPAPLFTVSGNGCTVPFGVTFTNTTTHVPGMTYAWNFGNGQTSTLQNPAVVTYTVAGTYTVTLVATNANTGCTGTYTHSINVSNFAAAITGPATVCVGQPITLLDNSTIGANSWSWDAASAGTSSVQNPTFVFNTPGTYSVTLTSLNTVSGCSGNATHQLTVLPRPVPTFTATPTTGCSPLSVNFTNTSGAGNSFKWVFGDGTTFTGTTPPAHLYTGNGTYDVKLIMEGTNGCKDSINIPALIKLSNPEAFFAATPLSGCTPLEVQFTDTSRTPNSTTNPIISWNWTFGDGTTFSGQNPPVHTYTPGKYDVRLIIVAQGGCSDTLVMPEYIQVGQIDGVGFTVDPSIRCAKNSIQFTNTSVITVPHQPDEVIYFWDFGDDQNSSEENPTHSYEVDTGYFDVTLIIDFRGCKDTLIIPNAVYIKAPISKFTPAQTLYCNPASLPVNVPVTDNSIIGKTTDDVAMIWRWGDGSITNFGNADLHDADKGSTSHSYNAYGSYNIKQVIYNYTTGCSDSTEQVVHISRTAADFVLSNDSICKNTAVTMNGSSTTSSHPMGTWSYNMGNGNVVTGQPASYVYTQAGTYTITLTATNSVGCAHTKAFNPFRVLELPVAQITANHPAGCAPLVVTFTNGSSVQGNGVPLSHFDWTFLDDNSHQTTNSVGATVNHTYVTEGDFTATLIATDVFGCKSSPASTNVLITKPDAQFTVDPVVCDEEVFSSANTSTGIGNITYQWSIDGVPNVTTQNITTSFNENQSSTIDHVSHVLRLIVTDANGCKDTMIRTVVVSMPIPRLTYTMNGASVNGQGSFNCPPVFVDFQDHSVGYGNIVGWAWDFDDNGNSSTNQDPSNTYVFPGTYNTTMTITDEFGCKADTLLFEYLTIFGPSGTPSFVQSPDACGQNVTFTLSNMQNVAGIEWDLGDGTIVKDSTHFTHSYMGINTYHPSVKLTDSTGCVVLYPMNSIVINDNGLVAAFTYSPNEIDLGQIVVFHDQSTFTNSPIISWIWNLGDGTVIANVSGSDVSHLYPIPGYQTVVLTVTDAQGCKSQVTKVIFIDPDFDMPNVFTPNGDGVNDFFALNNDFFIDYEVTIQNRWGNVVKYNKGQQGIIMWDGFDQAGKLCHDGVYFYQFKGLIIDGITVVKKAGFVTLLGTK